MAGARGTEAGARNLDRGSVAAGARPGDPRVRQARRVVRYRPADAVRPRPEPAFARRSTPPGASTGSTTSTPTSRFRPVPISPSAISSAAASRIRARRSTSGGGCRSSTTTTASPAPSARTSDLAGVSAFELGPYFFGLPANSAAVAFVLGGAAAVGGRRMRARCLDGAQLPTWAAPHTDQDRRRVPLPPEEERPSGRP